MYAVLLSLLAPFQGPTLYLEEQKVIPPNLGNNDLIGQAVAIDGDTACVTRQGRVFVFERIGGVWTYQINLSSSSSSSQSPLAMRFGRSVALSGDTIVAGAEWAETAGYLAGAAFVFERSAGVWTEVAELHGSDTNLGDTFGSSVAIDGDRMIIGAERTDQMSLSHAGAIYVFERQPGGAWSETAKLLSTPVLDNGHFPYSLALEGDQIVAGWVNYDDFKGALVTFELDPALGWVQTSLHSPSDLFDDAFFGWSCDLSGARCIVGAHRQGPSHAQRYGAAYAFERDPVSGWAQTQRLDDPAPAPLSEYGWEVALQGDHALVGVRHDRPLGFADRGSVMAYTHDGAEWRLDQTVLHSDGGQADNLGWAVDIDFPYMIAGAPRAYGVPGLRTGAAYIYDIVPASLGGAYCGPAPANSTGYPGRMGAIGSASVAQSDVTLLATGLPYDSFGYFLASRHQGLVPNPGGSLGNLCLALPIGRYASQVQSTGGLGHLVLPIDIAAIPTDPLSAAAAGDHWNFQGWYRDAGRVSLFTDAVEIVFE